MDKTYKVTFDNGKIIEVKHDTDLLEISKIAHPEPERPLLGVFVNNTVCDLREKPNKDCQVKFIDITHPDGYRIYSRGLCMVLAKANHELYPDRDLKILHAISKGIFCRWSDHFPMKYSDIQSLKEKMEEIIEKDLPFVGKIVKKAEAEEIFNNKGKTDQVSLIKFRKKDFMRVYFCEDYPDYFFGRLPPSSGCLEKFELKSYPPGLLMRFPNIYSPNEIPPYEPQVQHERIYREYRKWGDILEVSLVSSLNSIIMRNEINDFILIAEGLHEKKIAAIADLVARNTDQIKLILVAGPSCSGKTTFAQRLIVQLRVNGLRPIALSMDDYYVNNENAPLDEEGKPDFDHINCIDLPLFNEHLEKLLEGEKVMVPGFDFKEGKRKNKRKELQLTSKNLLLIEGIHGLNPILTEAIHPDNKFGIYVSPLTQLNLDNHNRIPTTDTRIIRRIVRDSKFRNYTALETIIHWPMVRRGEERFIFPFQEQAHVMFNSGLMYELAVLKNFVEPLLKEIPPTRPEYAEAKRLLSFTSNFLPIGTERVPANSILGEFTGISCFRK